jgi:hypothetical protein
MFMWQVADEDHDACTGGFGCSFTGEYQLGGGSKAAIIR